MRLAIIIILVVFICLTAYQDVRFYNEWRDVRLKYVSMQSKLQTLKKENAKIEEDLYYYQNPENLEKEIRAALNYKKPGEKVIVVVPK